MTTQITITVKRPSGEVETVDVGGKFPGGVPRHYYDQMVEATRAAGRGEIIAASKIIEPQHHSKAESDRIYKSYRRAMAGVSHIAQTERAGDINRHESDGAR